MKIVTVAEMIEIEQASDRAGHSYDAMMELAGRAVAAAILRHMDPWDSTGGTLVLAGPGNNGGDGLVAARYLRQWTPKRPVTIYCWKRDPDNDPNYDAARRLKIPIAHAERDPEFAQLADWLNEADVILDALLGTGVSRPIGGTLADLLATVHRSMESRQMEEELFAQDMEPVEPADAQSAATALQPVGEFDFLRFPPYSEAVLPQVVAVDCPSGLNCDTGILDPAALVADLTVTFANPKVGHLLRDGPRSCGELQVADIGTDPGLDSEITATLATPAYVKALLPSRPSDAHKGTFGKAMLVAGSVNYTGAAHLAGAAAYRVGSGLVTLAIPSSLHAALAAGLTETTWLPLPETLGVLNPEAVPVLVENLEGYVALLVGPGLTQEKETVQFVHRLLGVAGQRKRRAGFTSTQSSETGQVDEADASNKQSQDQPTAKGRSIGFLAMSQSSPRTQTQALDGVSLVLDADALNALAQADQWASQIPPDSILTPHPGEMARLAQCSNQEVQADRIGLARSKASTWNQVILLKGAYSVIAAPDGRIVVLPFTNPALATAGSGDVLAGAIAGLLSQGLAPFEAAVLGGYLHGLAGEMARMELGEAGVMAGDLLERLPHALRQLRTA
jgi:NAD(P)H-hydrate epimerase